MYDQQIGRALQDAVARIPAPPESRWVPQRSARSSPGAALVAIAATILILLSGFAIAALRTPHAVPSTPGDPFSAAEEATWMQVRAALQAGAVILRPTWLPDEFKGTGTAFHPSPQVQIADAAGTYTVDYYGSVFMARPEGRSRGRGCLQGNEIACQTWSRVEIKTLTVKPEESFYGVELVDVAPLSARGTTVRVRVGPRVPDQQGEPHQLIYMNWLENGTSYELNTLDVSMTDLTRVLHGLAPMK